MQELQIQTVRPLEKGRASVKFDNGMEVILYKGEMRKLSLREGCFLTEEAYRRIIDEIIGTRAKKRAMYLLEKMDRTERQLSEKLKQNGYPEECILAAIDYVKKYHYIDDLRYAKTFIRFHQEKKSRQRLKTDLMQKGVEKSIIEQALDEEYDTDERIKIRELLCKRHYNYDSNDSKEMQKTYQFLMRRGFRSSDILNVMKYRDAMNDS